MSEIYRKALIVVSFSVFLLGGLFFYQTARFNDGKLHLIFCNVGQGDGIYIRTEKGLDILVDAGPDDSILSCLSNHMPFWDRTIELVILTHPHSDHFTGLFSILKSYNILSFYTQEVNASHSKVYEELLKLILEKKVTKQTLFAKDKLVINQNLKLDTIWPIHKSINDPNQASVVELLSYKNFKALLTGDAGTVFENEISQDFNRVDILKVAHHGSKDSLNKTLLDELEPQLAVISVGKNSYGHPNGEILKILREKDIKILRTDKDGEIEIVSDGQFWEARK